MTRATKEIAISPDLYLHVFKSLDGMLIVLAPGQVKNSALPVSDAGKNHRAMADRFVSRHTHLSVQRPSDLLDTFHAVNKLRNLRADFIGARKLPLQQITFALFDPALESLKTFDVVPERLAHRVAVQQTYITP